MYVLYLQHNPVCSNAVTVAGQDKKTSCRQTAVSSQSLKWEDVSQDDHEGVLVAAGEGLDA